MYNEQDLKNTPEYRSGMFRIVTCPVCSSMSYSQPQCSQIQYISSVG